MGRVQRNAAPWSVAVRNSVLGAMLVEARLQLPAECCGLAAGAGEVVTELFPLRNALASAHAYFADPAELIRTFRVIRERGLRHIGIYHSHPNGDNFPSPSDVELAYYPSSVYFIVNPREGVSNPVRAFSIAAGCVTELAIAPTPP